MTVLSKAVVSLDMLEKEMGLPEGAKIAYIVQRPEDRCITIWIAHDKEAKEVSVKKLSQMGVMFEDNVPEEFVCNNKGTVRGAINYPEIYGIKTPERKYLCEFTDIRPEDAGTAPDHDE